VREWITVAQAAEIIGVSISRVHQFITEPCPDCGTRTYRTEDGVTVIDDKYGNGCEWCDYKGMRLPTYGRFGKEHRYGFRLDKTQVEKLANDIRKPGYPKGRKRRKKSR
jgi:hypothetical protein